MADFKKVILCDFDGVIHSYVSGWKGARTIPDTPVIGALKFLEELVEDDRFEVCIYSSRSKTKVGIDAMKDWLLYHGLRAEIVHQIEFPTQKPAAWLTIDDRAIQFDGFFPSLKELDEFKPWYKK